MRSCQRNETNWFIQFSLWISFCPDVVLCPAVLGRGGGQEVHIDVIQRVVSLASVVVEDININLTRVLRPQHQPVQHLLSARNKLQPQLVDRDFTAPGFKMLSVEISGGQLKHKPFIIYLLC